MNKSAIIFIPGTLLSPIIFEKITVSHNIQRIDLSWMTEPGLHDIRHIAENIVTIIMKQKFDKVILAGQSSGGSIAMLTYLYMQDKERIKGMVLSNCGANNIGHSNQKSKEEIIASWNKEALKIFIKNCFSYPLEQSFYERLIKYGSQFSAEQRIEPLISQREIDLKDRLCEIKCLTFIAHGRLDKIRTLDHAMQLKNGIPKSELLLLDGGHTPMYEDYAGYQKIIDRILTETISDNV